MQADLLLSGGAIYTHEPSTPKAGALAVADGRVLAADADPARLEDLRGPHTRVVDLHGRAVVPGFVDAHVHFGSFALGREQVDLDGAATLAEGLRLLQTAAGRLRDGEWLRGRGWDRNRWGRLPTAADLASAIGERPAALASHDGHAVWLSPSALRLVGIDRSVPDPPGGVIARDEDGEPSGVLFENAQDLVRARMPEPDDHALRAAIERALRIASSSGLTGIHNLEDNRTRRVFEAIEGAGGLTLRVYHGVPRGELRKALAERARTGVGSDWLRVGPVKLFSDGALGSRTAHLLEPYVGARDGYRGVPTMTPDELAEAMRAAADAGLDIAVHAIGDAAVRTVLDTYAATRAAHAPLGQRMLRIEHAQLIHPDDLPRFAQLGAIASMQPIHAIADEHTADAQWGDRARFAYAWRSVLDSGATLAFGTDAPVERIEPLRSLAAATTRTWYAAQRLSFDDALRAYTVGSAAAERASHRRGRLVAGMDADLVVLSRDPFAADPAALAETGVDMTVVGGRITYGD